MFNDTIEYLIRISPAIAIVCVGIGVAFWASSVSKKDDIQDINDTDCSDYPVKD